LFVLWASDSGALFTGKWMGQRKFAVHISPSKTVAGFVGGLVFGGLVAVLTAMGFSLSWGVIQSLGIGLILSLAGQLGDLAESMLKREAGVKDSGRLIPGHGGFLDRLDSLLFAVPVFYLVIRLG
ncbi:MAG TPA: phosphatidate cytidylyltransferase, partial [Magnetococcales bacterium]|nr:phosphatidate cytidylyltransferase [Magnetococcales bacterium]